MNLNDWPKRAFLDGIAVADWMTADTGEGWVQTLTPIPGLPPDKVEMTEGHLVIASDWRSCGRAPGWIVYIYRGRITVTGPNG